MQTSTKHQLLKAAAVEEKPAAALEQVFQYTVAICRLLRPFGATMIWMTENLYQMTPIRSYTHTWHANILGSKVFDTIKS